MRHVPLFTLLSMVIVLAAGCGGGGDPDPAPVGVVKVFTLPNTLDASWTLTGPAGAVITGTDDARHSPAAPPGRGPSSGTTSMIGSGRSRRPARWSRGTPSPSSASSYTTRRRPPARCRSTSSPTTCRPAGC
ncbi:MAG: hypothetical protein IPI34_00865 [bacterium]|nr:hypothetical protein [bacterium]